MAKEQRPRISINKLAEFMLAKGARKRQILKDQKFPSFKGIYYREASEAVGSCVASGLENVAVVTNQISVLEQMSSDKIGTQRRIAANLDALEAFLGMLDSVVFSGAEPRLGATSAPLLTVHGIDISVRPEVILAGKAKSKEPLIGAMKIHFPRTFSLNTDSAGYVSAVTQEWCKVHLYDQGQSFGAYCSVIDVGSKTVFPGVKATVARMKDVEAECQNIAALWPSITQSD